MDDMVRRGAVDGLAFGKNMRYFFGRGQAGQAGALRCPGIFRKARPQKLRRDIQKKHCAHGAHEFAVALVKHHAAACGDHRAWARALPQGRAFQGTKSGPAAPGHNLLHLQAAHGTDMLVGIKTCELKVFGQQAPQGAFPAGACADEEDKKRLSL